VSYAAGQKVSTATLDTVGSTAFQFIGAAQTTSSINLTGTLADLTGTSLTFSTQYANTKVGIWAVFDATFTNNIDIGVGGAVLIGTCTVDGVSFQPNGEAHYNGVRATVAQQWTATLAAAGNHTIKLQGKYLGSAPTGNIQTLMVHTRWSGLVFGP
jgi:hypothetical protein